MTYPLSQTQMGIYVTCMNCKEGRYNIDLLYTLDQDIDLQRLAVALDKVIEAHPYVKSRLVIDDNGNVGFEDHSSEPFHTKIIDAVNIDDYNDHIGSDYDLLHDSLFRLEIYRTGGGNYLYVDFHHIIFDGISFSVFSDELSRAYNGETIDPEPINGFEIAKREIDVRQSKQYEEAAAWYEKEFGDAADIDSKPLPDVNKEKEEHYTIEHHFLNIDKEEIKAFCERTGTKESSLFSAVFGYTLSRFTGDNKVLYSTVYHGRSEKLTRRSFCMMVKTLPVYHDFTKTPTVIGLLQQTREQMAGNRSHLSFSYGDLHAKLGVNSDVSFAYHGVIVALDITINGRIQKKKNLLSHTPGFKLIVQVFTRDKGYEISIDYATNLYSEEFIQTLCNCYNKVLEEMLVKENLCDISLCDELQLKKLEEFNRTECDYDNTQTIPSLFRKAAAMYPDNECVVYDGRIYTYKEVDAISDSIAWMIHERGIGREQVVSVLIPRCEYMAIASLGIVKAGAAYQPLDPTYPEERLNFMMKDADARLLICDRSLRAKVNEYEGDVVYTDELVSLPETGTAQQQELLAVSPNPQDLFILLYTSGSTGTPKGCQIEQRNIVAFCHWYQREYQLTSESRASAYASYGFDANMMDTWPALTIGASVHIISEDLRMNLVGLNDYFEYNGITHCLMTTQIGRQFATEIDNHSLHHLNVGGEKLVPCNPPKNFMLHNAYGPTEGTIVATSFVVDRLYANVPIGRPVDNMKAYVIDKQKHLLPVGAAGELCISGPQVTRGYLNRPEQTALAYEPNPFSNKDGYERIYHTGDIVRWLPDGNIEFVGRKDAQVKIRGFRIELTEVEAVVREYPQIKDATVQAFDAPGGGKFICAYIVSDEKVDVQRLNAFIEERKPPYMVPAVTMQIDKIPLNQNQKVNKKALPKPERQSLADENADDAPRQLNLLEQKLVEMIGQIIGNPPTVSTPLTYCGLSSILAIRLAAQLFKSFGINLTGKELLGSATVLSIENLILEKMLSGEPTQSEASAPAASADKPTESPLTFAQQGVYFDCVRNPEATTYNIPMCFTFDKTVDARSLAQAVQAVADAHPVLRSRFEMRGNEVIQVITDATVQVEQLTLDDEQAEERKRGFIRPFNLEQAPLCHLAVVDTPSATLLLVDFHHLVFDGTSMSIFIRQTADALGGIAPRKEEFCYTEYALEQTAFAKSDAFAANKTYYAEMLRDMEHAAEIPANLHGNEAEGRLRLTDAPLAFEQVEQYAKEHGVTAASVMLAAAFYTTARFINADKVYLATVSSGRQDVRLCDTFGMFVNTMPLAVAIGKQTADEFIQKCCEVLQATVDHEAYPFARIAADYGFSPSVVFTYQIGVVADTIPGLKHYAPLAYDEAKFKVEICVQEKDGVPKVTVIYNEALYSESLMSTLAQSVAAAAMHLIGSVGQPLRSISLLGEQQRKALSDIHHTCIDASAVRFPLFHRSIEHYAVHTPDTVALIANNETLTYSMLNAKANVLAHALMARGVNMGDRVCLLLPRCSWHIIAMFGVMKAGAAYIPCDPEYPAERIRLITEDSHARYIITTADKMANYGDRALDVETLLKESGESEMQNPELEQSSDSLAYLIYTSGSTGRPKGVMLRHQGICNYLTPHPANLHIHAMAQRCNVMLNITTVSFDLSLKEIGASLYNGITLVMADEEQVNNPQALAQLMLSTHVDGFSGTPSRLKMFLDLPLFQEALSQCRYVILGGEKYPPTLLPIVKRLAPEAQLFNTYGPTEISVSCNGKELTHTDRITIGRPLLNVEEYVVDSDLNELPIGVTGELLIGGMGVAVGYNDLPEKTDEAFIMYKGTRCYKSGDYAYWNEDGEISILGRKDHQIKLNGLRIELGEVETVLNRQPQVKEGVVMIKNVEGRDHLVAYYTINEAVDTDTLKEQMGKSLTHYMIPTIFMQIDRMPVSPNGKTDLKALPEPELNTHEYVAPQNEAESFFCNTFAEILNLPRVGVTDHFFELGGTSLVAIRVVMAAMQQGYKIVYKQVFEHPTPRALAALVCTTEATNDPTVEKTIADSAVVSDVEADNYDYTAINRLLQGNTLASLGTEPLRPLGTCIVTGATGFLGIHVVRELIGHPEVKSIYCLVRSNRMQQAEERLRTQLFYYFGDTYNALFGSRLIVVDGDITQKDSLDSIPKSEGPVTLFNCAANVKHFSAGTDIEDINIGGCQTCIDFCLKHGARLIQTSTHSIAGTKESDGPCEPDVLNEQRLYWGQNLANQYAHAKFIAERNVLEAIVSRGLDAKIMRLGNLSARSSDGEFQINFKSNTFMGRLKAYQTIGCMPYQMVLHSIEFSPIEEVARAIVMLSATPCACTVFHPVNAHRELFDDIIVCLDRLGIHIQTVEQDEYQRRLADAFNNPAQAPILQSLMAYQSETGKVVVSNVDDYSYTTQSLLRMGFRWNFTSWDYIEQFITAIAGLGFFDEDYQR